MLGATDPLKGILPPGGDRSGNPFDLRRAGAAGALVGTPTAAAQYLAQVLPQASELLETLYPMQQPGPWYGLGLMVYDVTITKGPGLWIGHSGSVPGARAIVAFAPDLDAVIAVTMTGEGSSESVANLFFEKLTNMNE